MIVLNHTPHKCGRLLCSMISGDMLADLSVDKHNRVLVGNTSTNNTGEMFFILELINVFFTETNSGFFLS